MTTNKPAPALTVVVRPGQPSPAQQAAWAQLWERVLAGNGDKPTG